MIAPLSGAPCPSSETSTRSSSPTSCACSRRGRRPAGSPCRPRTSRRSCASRRAPSSTPMGRGRLQGDEAVLDLFGWKEGQLTFVPEDKPVRPERDPGRRRADPRGRSGWGTSSTACTSSSPSDRVVFQMAARPPDDGRALRDRRAEWRVLRLVDGLRDVRELLEASGAPAERGAAGPARADRGGLPGDGRAAAGAARPGPGALRQGRRRGGRAPGSGVAAAARFARGVHRVEVRSRRPERRPSPPASARASGAASTCRARPWRSWGSRRATRSGCGR